MAAKLALSKDLRIAQAHIEIALDTARRVAHADSPVADGLAMIREWLNSMAAYETEQETAK